MRIRIGLPLLTAVALTGFGLAAVRAQQADMSFFVSSVGTGNGADLGGLPDDHTGRVVDEQPGTEYRARVDVHSGEHFRQCGAEPGEQPAVAPPQRVADPVSPDRVHARVAEHELGGAAGSRIPFPGRPEITSQGSHHR